MLIRFPPLSLLFQLPSCLFVFHCSFSWASPFSNKPAHKEKILFLLNSTFIPISVSVFKESFQPDHSGSCTTTGRTCQCWDQGLFPADSFSSTTGAHLTPAHLTHSQTWFSLSQPQVSHSVKQFIHKMVELVPLKKDPQQRNPWAFIPPQSPHAQVSLLLLSSQLLPSSLCSFTLLESPTLISFHYPECQEFLTPAISQSPFPWLVLPIFLPFVIPKAGRSLPLVRGSHPELHLRANPHLILQLTSPALGPGSSLGLRPSLPHHCHTYFQTGACPICFTYIVLVSK